MSCARNTPTPPADLLPFALTCNGFLEDGSPCLEAHSRGVNRFRSVRALRRDARKQGWRVGLSPQAVLDLCPECYGRERKRQEAANAGSARPLELA